MYIMYSFSFHHVHIIHESVRDYNVTMAWHFSFNIYGQSCMVQASYCYVSNCLFQGANIIYGYLINNEVTEYKSTT